MTTVFAATTIGEWHCWQLWASSALIALHHKRTAEPKTSQQCHPAAAFARRRRNGRGTGARRVQFGESAGNPISRRTRSASAGVM